MRSKKIRCVALLIMIMSLFIFTGCGTNSLGSSSSTSQTLVIGMSASNIPTTDVSPSEGYEGWRFVGFQLYEGLTKWNLTQSDQPAEVEPGLATSWEVSKSDPTLWTFHLRKGVVFHDQTPFNADAVIFNLNRVHNSKSKYFNPTLAGGLSTSLKYIKDYKKIDEDTVQIKTKEPYSSLPYDLTQVVFASPTAIKKYGKDYQEHPAGTGPFKFKSITKGQELVLEKNEDYWGNVPKLKQLVLLPMPDASTRLAALKSGDINWAEVPPSEAIKQLKKDHYQVLENEYPHNWAYVLNLNEKPWNDKRVRQAANYAINREGLSKALLNGAATPATQVDYPGSTWYSDDAIQYKYDPKKAKELLKEAGYPKGFKTTFMVPTSGSGNMWPIEMNEYIQKNLKAVGINVTIEAVEWQTLLNQYLSGFPKDNSVGAINISLPTNTPMIFDRYFSTRSKFPNGSNIGGYSNPKVDQYIQKATGTFDTAQRDKEVQQAAKLIAEDAPWIFVAHDLNLRVLAPDVQGFVQPQSWFADLTTVSINQQNK
ncbi:peptide/nickel transport system substrate-binding protein [Pullulanibacillus pueri]|uniref:ABC transporter substrate-binding protein n=1 Tax=Pullulanibacillus pueri TaxID=1437324 RepID=A0A8J3EMF6_9BACL|nr:ABC transporter substrate-binding protein [Pullulanibacillus pueri]MBM7682618.1 peptide/nickel transport system substrate-binding protein [Pullulanibacillus pueri]GGH82529.1 ABC transporter substrate-binding protein [Pullulanibacillus pueri]